MASRNQADAPVAVDARRALLERLIDHAALFPPASMSLEDALAEDARARSSAHAWMLGRFICPASRAAALEQARGGWEGAPALSVVADGAGAADAEDWLEALERDLAAVPPEAPVELLEARLPAAELAAPARERVDDGVAVWFEVPLGDELPELVAAIGAAGAGAKVRCGGATAAAFPSVERLARFVATCRDAGVPFKATAGLHHPIRHVEPGTGFPMHGFLNLLAAAVLADAHGLDAAALEPVLAEERADAFAVDHDGIAVAGHAAGAGDVARARVRLFTAYGSCSFFEPVEGLQALGILA